MDFLPQSFPRRSAQCTVRGFMAACIVLLIVLAGSSAVQADSAPGATPDAGQQPQAQPDSGQAPEEPPVGEPPAAEPQEVEALDHVVADAAMAEAVEDDLDYLFELLAGSGTEFDVSRVEDLVRLVLAKKETLSDFNPEERDDASSAYGQIELNVGLGTLISYMFNPNLPSYLAMPSLVRLGGWRDREQALRQLSGIWNQMPFTSPRVFHGVEYEVSTPSLEVGAFYAYDLNRCLVFFNYQGRNALLSLTRMAAESEVGKKGLAIGDPDRWMYFYSDAPGAMSSLANMVDTYIYDSISVNLFIETAPGASSVRLGIFKWLKAGGGLFRDMVGESDIRGGFDDFRDILKAVLESPNLPSTLAIRDYMGRVDNLTDEQLRELLTPFARQLEELALEGGDMADSDFSVLIANGAYVNSLSREEMESELFKRFLYASLHNQPHMRLPEPGDAAETGVEVDPVDEPPVHLVPELYEDEAVAPEAEATPEDAAPQDDVQVGEGTPEAPEQPVDPESVQ